VQVQVQSTRSNLAQLLKERSELFGAIADAWGKEAENDLTRKLAQQATANFEAVAEEVSKLEAEVAERSEEASAMRERMAELEELSLFLKEKNRDLQAEVATLTDELEVANEKVAEVETEAAGLWRTQEEDRNSVCDLRMQLRAREDRIADMQQTTTSMQVSLSRITTS
jgi:predicted  nucleic acid-binding Zn-ribbon protein